MFFHNQLADRQVPTDNCLSIREFTRQKYGKQKPVDEVKLSGQTSTISLYLSIGIMFCLRQADKQYCEPAIITIRYTDPTQFS